MVVVIASESPNTCNPNSIITPVPIYTGLGSTQTLTESVSPNFDKASH